MTHLRITGIKGSMACAVLATATSWAWSEAASAAGKSIALRTPSGRRIYADDAEFALVGNQDRRHLIIELLSGLAPEGHLGLLLGVINAPIKGLEFYSGIAFEINPAYSIPISARYMMNFGGYRPYVSAGYVYRALDKVDVWSHNAFAEVGYKWVIHHTYHLTVGVGVRRPLMVVVEEDSELRGADTDPALLNEQIERSKKFIPTVALRFSRAF